MPTPKNTTASRTSTLDLTADAQTIEKSIVSDRSHVLYCYRLVNLMIWLHENHPTVLVPAVFHGMKKSGFYTKTKRILPKVPDKNGAIIRWM